MVMLQTDNARYLLAGWGMRLFLTLNNPAAGGYILKYGRYIADC